MHSLSQNQKWILRKFTCCRGWRLLFFQFTVEPRDWIWASTFSVSITPWFRVGMQINQSSRYRRIWIPCNWRGAKAWDHSSNTLGESFWMRGPLSIVWDSWGREWADNPFYCALEGTSEMAPFFQHTLNFLPNTGSKMGILDNSHLDLWKGRWNCSWYPWVTVDSPSGSEVGIWLLTWKLCSRTPARPPHHVNIRQAVAAFEVF